MKPFTMTAVRFTLLPLCSVVAILAESPMSQLNRQRLEIGRMIVEQKAPLQDVLPFYTDDFEYYDPVIAIKGKADMQEFLTDVISIQPGFFTDTEDEMSVNGMYMSTWVMGGFLCVSPVDCYPYQAPGMSIVKFREKSTQVYFQRDYYSEGDTMKAIPALEGVLTAFRTMYLCLVDPIPPPPEVCSELEQP